MIPPYSWLVPAKDRDSKKQHFTENLERTFFCFFGLSGKSVWQMNLISFPSWRVAIFEKQLKISPLKVNILREQSNWWDASAINPRSASSIKIVGQNCKLFNRRRNEIFQSIQSSVISICFSKKDSIYLIQKIISIYIILDYLEMTWMGKTWLFLLPGRNPGTSTKVMRGILNASQKRTNRAPFTDELMSRQPKTNRTEDGRG